MAPLKTLAALAALLLVLVISSAAQATHISCGQVLTTDTKLDSDVVCPPTRPWGDGPGFNETALIIGADKITVDGAGFRIVNPDGIEGVAIGTLGERRKITLKNFTGRSDGFGVPMDLNVSQSVIKNNNASGPYGGAGITGDHNTIKGNRFGSGESYGLAVEGNDVRVTDNVTSAAYAVALVVSGSRLTVRENVARTSGIYEPTLQVRDAAGQGVVVGNRVFVDRNAALALLIEGGKRVRNNEVICSGGPTACSGQE